MNSAIYVDEQIKVLKSSGIPLSEAAWKAANLCLGWPYIFGDRGQYCTSGQRKAVYNKHPDQEGLISKCQILNGKKSDCGGCKWYPNGKRVRSFDCRGFTYWILFQIYGWELMGGGCTTQWDNENNWKAKGDISTIPEDTLVCLFYRDKKDPRKMAHTGFGFHGETIECSNGVQYSKTRNKKWEYWGIPACVEGDVPPTPPTPEKRPTLKKGSTGPYVVECQEDLLKLGYDLSPYGADGKYGNKTAEAVKKFQSDHPPLVADGVCGPRTWDELDLAIQPTPVADSYIVSIPHLDLTQAKALCNAYPDATMKEER